MGGLVTDLLILLLLIIFNGFFAMAEIAVVSSRRARLRQRAAAGDARALLALDLAESPNRFLSTVQIGITLVGIGTGAMGEASFARRLAPWIAEVPQLAPYANQFAFGLVVVLLGYLSLVIGELVPKPIGLGNPEGLAIVVARPMQWLSRLARPGVNFLSASAETLLRLAGHRPSASAEVTEEEVRTLMQEGLRAGAFNKVESHIIDNALELDQLPVREIMTPRPKVIWLNAADTHEQVWHKIVVSNHSYFPVYQDSRENPIGLVSVKAIYANLAAGAPVDL